MVLLCFPSGCCMKMTCFSSLKSHQSLTQLWHQSPSCTNRPQIIFAHYICSSDIFKTNFSSFAFRFKKKQKTNICFMSFSVLSYSFSCAPLRWTSVYLKCEFYLFTFAHPSFRVKYYLFYLNFPSFEVFLKFWFEISFYLDIHFLIQYVLFYIIEVPAILLSFLLS